MIQGTKGYQLEGGIKIAPISLSGGGGFFIYQRGNENEKNLFFNNAFYYSCIGLTFCYIYPRSNP